MSFLRRFIGRREADATERQEVRATALGWWDPPPGGAFEIAGAAHHKDALAELFPPAPHEPDRNVSATATLLPEPGNPYDPNAVAVRIEGRTVGYIPAEVAPAWGDLIERLAHEGVAPRITAKLWIGQHAWFVNLIARRDAFYLTPTEAAAEAERREAELAAKTARKAARRDAARPATAATPPGVCRDCGAPIEPTGKRGRPPVRCAACRGVDRETSAAGSAARLAAPAVAARPPATPEPVAPVQVPWVALPRPAAWAVVDIETTGLFPKVDRIVEIAVVRLARDGSEMDSWTTMLNPQRDMGVTDMHGIYASDVRDAPTFADIADEFAARVSDTPLAAHNARFDLDFLAAAMARAGVRWPRPDALCTMAVPNRLGIVSSRSLDACCAEIGLPYDRGHTALSDARSAAGLLAFTLRQTRDRVPVPEPAPSWPDPDYGIRPRLRSQPPTPRFDTTRGQLADRVGVPAGMEASIDAALAYMGVLDLVLEDRHITDAEVEALHGTAAGWGLDGAAVRRLHAAYLAGMWSLARADGVVTPHERHDLDMLSDLLGVPLDGAALAEPVVPVARSESLVGKSVCFTGGSVVTIGGAKLAREDQEALATEAGLVVRSGVTKGLDLLVMADPDSQSGKAQKADAYGTRRIAEPAFWRAIGVEID